ncbi:MAG: transglutaminase-like domain-containing protein [Bryobacteraceae bacterium]|nr:transglutaminase-like domain-containing protein [Bryobacteraceae bacterium]MDW8379792.1 transglutaminase-like domain-containing protein [Bryobacterales bacterium]
MRELIELLAGNNEEVALDVAALELATIEFPGLDVSQWLILLDSYAQELSERVSPQDDPLTFIETANQFLFEELGFRGNEGDYYSPLNSCLNQVLVERTGLPITLSLVYMEIGRRLERPILGIGMPGHFLTAYDDDGQHIYVDPFHRGRILEGEECLSLASRITGLDLHDHWEALAPVSKRQMALRMLNNLRAAYLRRGTWEKALRVQELLVRACPLDAVEYRQRGYLYLQLKRYREAAADLLRYLALDPEARDRADVERRLVGLRRWIADLN